MSKPSKKQTLLRRLNELKAKFSALKKRAKESATMRMLWDNPGLRREDLLKVRQKDFDNFVNYYHEYQALLEQAKELGLVEKDFEANSLHDFDKHKYHRQAQLVLEQYEKEFKSAVAPEIAKLAANYDGRVKVYHQLYEIGLTVTAATSGLGLVFVLAVAMVHLIDKLITHIRKQSVYAQQEEKLQGLKQGLKSVVKNTDDVFGYRFYRMARNMHTLFKPFVEIKQQAEFPLPSAPGMDA